MLRKSDNVAQDGYMLSLKKDWLLMIYINNYINTSISFREYICNLSMVAKLVSLTLNK